MLKIDNISFAYKASHPIFEKVSLNIAPGEVVGLYGKSGIGKSTFAKVVAGYLSPSQGTVSVDGKTYSPRQRNPVQMVGQHPEKAINPYWKMSKVLKESGTYNIELLEEFGISQEWMHRYPSQLSGGELQRFCLARAMVPETKYLIADEMTTMLDAITQAQMWTIVNRFVEKRNLGVLVISHEMPLLKRVCHHLLNFDQLVDNTHK